MAPSHHPTELLPLRPVHDPHVALRNENKIDEGLEHMAWDRRPLGALGLGHVGGMLRHVGRFWGKLLSHVGGGGAFLTAGSGGKFVEAA